MHPHRRIEAPEYEAAVRGRRPAAVLRRARAEMTPEERKAARERRLAELEAEVGEHGDNPPEAA